MKKLIFILSLVLLFSCTGKQKENAQSNLTVIPVVTDKSIPLELSDLFKEVSYVKLATKDSCLIGEINKLLYVDDYIVVCSDHNAILFFNKNGTFSHKIYHQGNGPGEYLSISDFEIDRKDHVITLLDASKKQLLQYDWDGTFIKKSDLNCWAVGFQQLNDSICVLYSGNQLSEENKYKLTVYNLSSCNVSAHFYPISKEKSSYLHVFTDNNFSRSGDEVLLCEMFNDTIYSVSASRYAPRYYIDFGKQKIPSSFYEAGYADIMDFQTKLHKHDYSYGMSSLANFQTGFITSCFIHKRKHFIYYNKGTQIAVAFNQLTDKAFLGSTLVDVTKCGVRFFSDGANLLMLADNELYANELDSHSVLKKQLGEVKIDDNPTILLYKLKEK